MGIALAAWARIKGARSASASPSNQTCSVAARRRMVNTRRENNVARRITVSWLRNSLARHLRVWHYQ